MSAIGVLENVMGREDVFCILQSFAWPQFPECLCKSPVRMCLCHLGQSWYRPVDQGNMENISWNMENAKKIWAFLRHLENDKLPIYLMGKKTQV